MNRDRVRWIGGAVILLGGVLLWAVNPAQVAWLPPCWLHKLTGWHCPGCGTTRALHALAHGQVAAAFGLNPLVMGLLPLLGWWTARRCQVMWKPWLGWMLLGIVVLFGIARNMPQYPFTLLAP